MKMKYEPIEITLERNEIPVTINRPGEPPLKGKLVELDGTERDRWLNDMGRRMRYNAKGEPAGMTSQDGAQANLIARCFVGDGGEKLDIAEIQKFPTTQQKKLHDACARLCGLDREAQEEAKND